MQTNVLLLTDEEVVLGDDAVDDAKMRDQKRTKAYPHGQPIYEGDIIQFPIQLMGQDGKARRTMVQGTVAIDPDYGWFIVPEIDDGDSLALHYDECEVIGTIYAQPELIQGLTGEASSAGSSVSGVTAGQS
jgi:YopX protein